MFHVFFKWWRRLVGYQQSKSLNHLTLVNETSGKIKELSAIHAGISNSIIGADDTTRDVLGQLCVSANSANCKRHWLKIWKSFLQRRMALTDISQLVLFSIRLQPNSLHIYPFKFPHCPFAILSNNHPSQIHLLASRLPILFGCQRSPTHTKAT